MVRVIARRKPTVTKSPSKRFGIKVIARRRTGSGGGRVSKPTPTTTEKILKTSLPSNLRNRPVAQVRKELTVARRLASQGSAGRITTFGQPRKFARSFRRATGSSTFTLAVPIKRQAGNIVVRDFNFAFSNGKIIKAKPTGRAILTENQFLLADLRRRKKNPKFTFGSTLR